MMAIYYLQQDGLSCLQIVNDFKEIEQAVRRFFTEEVQGLQLESNSSSRQRMNH